jgi:hypothetical protein
MPIFIPVEVVVYHDVTDLRSGARSVELTLEFPDGNRHTMSLNPSDASRLMDSAVGSAPVEDRMVKDQLRREVAGGPLSVSVAAATAAATAAAAARTPAAPAPPPDDGRGPFVGAPVHTVPADEWGNPIVQQVHRPPTAPVPAEEAALAGIEDLL